jgi:hypothetical protein
MLAIAQKLLDAKSVDETTGTTPASYKRNGCERVVHTIEWGTGVSAGVVEVEAADSPDYAGTWVPLATFTYASGSPKAETLESSGRYGAFRHRISTAIVGGTVTTKIRGSR